MNSDGTITPNYSPTDGAYPMLLPTYLMAPTNDVSAGVGKSIQQFLNYAVQAGQTTLPTGYVPLTTALVNESLAQVGMSEWPLISLLLGLAGACAIITSGTLLAHAGWLKSLRFCGKHSIVIYLAFFLPMASTRTLLLRTGLIHDIGTVSLIVTVAGVVGALLIWRAALAAKAAPRPIFCTSRNGATAQS